MNCAEESLRNIHLQLLDFHRSLLHFQGKFMEEILQRRINSYELWKMSMNDPNFEWLRRISSLIVLLDEHFEDREMGAQDILREIQRDLRTLFFTGQDRDFQFRLRMALEKEPSLYTLIERIKGQVEENSDSEVRP